MTGGDKLFMKKRDRIILLTVMILAVVIVFLIILGPAGSGRDTGDENTMTSSDSYQCEKGTYIGEGGINVLAELTEGRGIHPGEQLIHLQIAGEKEPEGGTSPE